MPSAFRLSDKQRITLKAEVILPSTWFQKSLAIRKRLHDSILSIISVSSTFASLNLNK